MPKFPVVTRKNDVWQRVGEKSQPGQQIAREVGDEPGVALFPAKRVAKVKND